jgi:hypothetical protein
MSENGAKSGDLDWGEIGEVRWRELATAAGASELQLKFAVARHAGATLGVAARLAGYSDSDGRKGAHRSAGYSALRSTAVQNLLELAAIESPDEAAITDIEVDAKIAKLVRSPDPNVALKAIEARNKAQDRRQQNTDEFDWGSVSMDEAFLHSLREDRVAGAVMTMILLYAGQELLFGTAAFGLFAPLARKEMPDLWRKACTRYPDIEALGEAPLRPLDAIIAELARVVGKPARPMAVNSTTPAMEASVNAAG